MTSRSTEVDATTKKVSEYSLLICTTKVFRLHILDIGRLHRFAGFSFHLSVGQGLRCGKTLFTLELWLLFIIHESDVRVSFVFLSLELERFLFFVSSVLRLMSLAAQHILTSFASLSLGLAFCSPLDDTCKATHDCVFVPSLACSVYLGPWLRFCHEKGK